MDNLKKLMYMPAATARFSLRKILDAIVHRKNKKEYDFLNLQHYRKAILCKLRKKYKKVIDGAKSKIDASYASLAHDRGNNIWIYWAQGVENAPPIVKVCIQSIFENAGGGYNVIILDDSNINDYVAIPARVNQLYKQGKIGKAFYSDVLRVELLIKYGGTWIDSTIFCSNKEIPRYMLDSDLFLFQCSPEERKKIPTRVESFFITACMNNKILMLCREIMYSYLNDNNFLIEYFLVYEFLELAIEKYPEEWEKVVYCPREKIFALSYIIADKYDEHVMKEILDGFPFHKLTYKPYLMGGAESGTHYLINNYGQYGRGGSGEGADAGKRRSG